MLNLAVRRLLLNARASSLGVRVVGRACAKRRLASGGDSRLKSGCPSFGRRTEMLAGLALELCRRKELVTIAGWLWTRLCFSELAAIC